MRKVIRPDDGYHLYLKVVNGPFSIRLLFALATLLKVPMTVNFDWEARKVGRR